MVIAIVWALGGLAFGCCIGDLAVLIPSGRWRSFPMSLGRLVNERRVEHLLGVALGTVRLTLAYLLRGSALDAIVTSLFLLILIPILSIDLWYRLVYPVMPLANSLAGLALNPLAGEASVWSSLLGGLPGTVVFLLLFLVGFLVFRVEALGFGDVLLAGMNGSMTSVGLTLSALFLGALVSGAGSAALLLLRRKRSRDFIPYGVGMCLAAMLVLLAR